MKLTKNKIKSIMIYKINYKFSKKNYKKYKFKTKI